MLNRILSHLGLIENTDYQLSGESFIMLPKTRMVDQIIEHEATEEAEAWTEVIQVEETYTPDAPTQEQLDRAELELRHSDLGDIMELIGQYLIGHDAGEDESLNPEAFSINHINNPDCGFWRINKTKPTLEALEQIKAVYDPQKTAKQVRENRIKQGRAAREACASVLDLIAGFNIENELSAQQVSDMVATFSQPLQALQLNRPSSARALIQEIEPSELVTQEMINECLLLLADW